METTKSICYNETVSVTERTRTILYGYPNQVEGGSVVVLGHYESEVRLAVRTARGDEATGTVRVGDAVPLLEAWTVKSIAAPLPALRGGEREASGRGSGRVALTISKN